MALGTKPMEARKGSPRSPVTRITRASVDPDFRRAYDSHSGRARPRVTGAHQAVAAPRRVHVDQRSGGARVMLYVSILASLLTLAGSARAQDFAGSLPARLSLGAALELLRTRGYDVLLAEATTQAVSAQLTQAQAVQNPQLNAGVGAAFCPGCSALPWTVGVSDQGGLTNALFGKRRLRVDVAKAALAAARFARADALRVLEFQLKAQYTEVAVAERVLSFAVEVENVYNEVLKLTRIRWNAGAISEAEVAKAQTAELEAAQDVTSAEQGVEMSKAQLAFLLGVRGALPVFAIESELLDRAAPGALASASPAALLRIAYEQRADLKAVHATVQGAQIATRLAERTRTPDVALSLQGSGQGTGRSAISPPMLMFGVTVTPPLLYQSQGEISFARAQTRQAELEQGKLEAQVAQDVNLAFASYTATKRRLERMQSGLLESARRARDLVRIQYEKGAASLLELLDAQRTFITNNLEYLRDVADFRISVFQIEQAVGREMSQ